jgi:hypothetical protein
VHWIAPLFQLEDQDTVLGKIDVDPTVTLRPWLVIGITGIIPAAKCGILAAKELGPLSLRVDRDAVALVREAVLMSRLTPLRTTLRPSQRLKAIPLFL